MSIIIRCKYRSVAIKERKNDLTLCSLWRLNLRVLWGSGVPPLSLQSGSQVLVFCRLIFTGCTVQWVFLRKQFWWPGHDCFWFDEKKEGGFTRRDIILVIVSSVADMDLDSVGSGRSKNDHKIRKQLIHLNFWNAGCCLLRNRGFSCS